MALLFCDGMGETHARYKWDEYVGLDYGTYGRYIDYGIRFSGSNDHVLKYFTAGSDTIIVGGATKQATYYNNPTYRIMDLYAGSNSLVKLCYLGIGKLAVYLSGTLIGYTDNGTFNANAWHYLELKVYRHSTNGTVEVKIDEVTVFTATGLDTDNGYAMSALRIGAHYTTIAYWDDVYICNDVGTENNNFLGNIKITTLYPTADGVSSDFTPSTGVDNYATVDEEFLNSGEFFTDYNESNTIGHKDLYDVTDLSSVDTILGIQVCGAVVNDGGGSMNVRSVCRSGAVPTDNESDDLLLTSDGNVVRGIFEKEPTDDVSWTTENINTSEFGIKIQS